jgi:hypothetical protein
MISYNLAQNHNIIIYTKEHEKGSLKLIGLELKNVRESRYAD